MYVMMRMESADASLVSNKLPFGFADRNETSLSIHEVFTITSSDDRHVSAQSRHAGFHLLLTAWR